jgi:uncharacterized protein (DUF58 family)
LSRLIFIFGLVLLSALSCLAQTGKADFKFESEVYKFGKVKEGEVIEFTYAFTNTGTEPLIIQDIKVTCGCTVPDYPKAPVAPAQTGEIKVKFDTTNKIGYQDRTLEIISNAKNSSQKLRFKGTVDNK